MAWPRMPAIEKKQIDRDLTLAWPRMLAIHITDRQRAYLGMAKDAGQRYER